MFLARSWRRLRQVHFLRSRHHTQCLSEVQRIRKLTCPRLATWQWLGLWESRSGTIALWSWWVKGESPRYCALENRWDSTRHRNDHIQALARKEKRDGGNRTLPVHFTRLARKILRLHRKTEGRSRLTLPSDSTRHQQDTHIFRETRALFEKDYSPEGLQT